MMKTRILLAVWMVTCVSWGQGELAPPGPPAETMKTLEQVEPRIDLATVAGDATAEVLIKEPGSYYLSGNLIVSKDVAIRISSPDVTVDLNGFLIQPESPGVVNGIEIGAEMDRVTIRNGSIEGFSFGVQSLSVPAFAQGCRFEKLAVSGCAIAGIYAGKSARIVDCRVHDNPGEGIRASEGAVIMGCTVEGCQGSRGIHAGPGSTITGCAAVANEGTYGIYAEHDSAITGCAAFDNACSYGIYGANGVTISDCAAGFNQATYGIYVGSGAMIRGCATYDNTGSGVQTGGLRAGSGSLVVGCVSRFNDHIDNPNSQTQGMGISAGTASTVRDCTASNNRGDGIRVGDDGRVVGNACDSNGYGWGIGAGIYVTGADARLEANTVTDNDFGMRVATSGNFIVRNTASGNSTNYVIALGNKVGAIVNAPSSLAITGSTGGAGVGSTDPWANFSF